jgi:hypothetical protein
MEGGQSVRDIDVLAIQCTSVLPYLFRWTLGSEFGRRICRLNGQGPRDDLYVFVIIY